MESEQSEQQQPFLLFNVPQGFEYVALEEIYEKIPELKSLEYIIPPVYGLIYFKNCTKLTVDMLIQFKNLFSVDNIFVGVADYDVDLGERNKLPKEEKYKFIEDALYEGQWTHALNTWHFCTEHRLNDVDYDDLVGVETKKMSSTSADTHLTDSNSPTITSTVTPTRSKTEIIPEILKCRSQNLFDITQNNYFKSDVGCDFSQREIAFRGTFLKYDYKSKEVRTQQLASYIGDATFKKYMEEKGIDLFKGKLKVNLKQWDLEVWGAFIKHKSWNIGVENKHHTIANVRELENDDYIQQQKMSGEKDNSNSSVNTSTYDKYKILYGITIPLNNYINNDKSVNHRNRCKFGRTSLRPTVAYCLSRFSNIQPGMVVVDPCCGVNIYLSIYLYIYYFHLYVYKIYTIIYIYIYI